MNCHSEHILTMQFLEVFSGSLLHHRKPPIGEGSLQWSGNSPVNLPGTNALQCICCQKHAIVKQDKYMVTFCGISLQHFILFQSCKDLCIECSQTLRRVTHPAQYAQSVWCATGTTLVKSFS